MWDKVEKEGAEKNVIGWGKMGQNRKGWDKGRWEWMAWDGKGWNTWRKYLQNSTNKISKINNFYSTSNWIQVILIQISQVYTKI